MSATEIDREHYANPPMESILQAVPAIQWRKCWSCGLVALYRDNILPACSCHECGSADTRLMRKETEILGREEKCDA